MKTSAEDWTRTWTRTRTRKGAKIHVRQVLILWIVLALIWSIPSMVAAASYQFSSSAQTNFNKMIAAESSSVKEQLVSQYNLLQTNYKLELEWEHKVKSLRAANEELEKKLRNQIMRLDADKIKKQEEDIARLKKRYEPVIKRYDTLRNQLKIMKSVKTNKELVAAMNVSVSISKAAADTAKADIRRQEANLKTAKAAVNEKKKELRAMLTEGAALTSKIKTAKSSVQTSGRLYASESKLLTQAVRKQSASEALKSMRVMNEQAQAINKQKSSIVSYEQQYAQLLAKVQLQL